MPVHLDDEKRHKIQQLIDEYNSFTDDELRLTYMQKFNEVSKSFDLYNDNLFLEFLKQQIKTSNNKHIILESLFVLHNLILTSRLENKDSFTGYVDIEYLAFLKENMISQVERYEYSFFKIEQIIEDINISNEEICEIYWNRMVNMINNITQTDMTTNKLWNCINTLCNKNCKIKAEWRRWLITKDEHSDIKSAVLKELSHLAFL